jgi:predicted RNA binding protein YcfA (HicA-like mRNA interferase family)
MTPVRVDSLPEAMPRSGVYLFSEGESVSHREAVRALQKTGFSIVRQGKHVVMSNGQRILTIPRANPINAFTKGGIVKEPGSQLTREDIYSDSSALREMERFLSMSIDDALYFESPLVRCLALVGRRLGKRRLVQLSAQDERYPLAKELLTVRRSAEGVPWRDAV